MNIVFFEIKKLLRSKVLWLIVALSIALNISLVFINSYYREDLTYINEIAEKFGTKITAAGIVNIEEFYDAEFDLLNSQFKSATGRDFQFDDRNYTDAYPKIPDIGSRVKKLNIISAVIAEEKNIYESKNESSEEFKQQLESRNLKTDSKTVHKLSAIQKIFLSLRFSKADAVGEQNFLSQGIIYNLHYSLYSEIMFAFYLEMMFIAAFVTLYSLSSEFSYGTASLVYCTKRGKKLQKSKLTASMALTTVIFAAVACITLLTYFIYYPQSDFYDMQISSPMYGALLPKISFTLLGYLFANLATGLVLTLLFVMFAYIIGGVVKNSFFSLIIFAAVQLFLILTGFKGSGKSTSLMEIIFMYNPAAMLITADISNGTFSANCGNWYMLTDLFKSLPFYEFTVIIMWLIINSVLSKCSTKFFNRRDIK